MGKRSGAESRWSQGVRNEPNDKTGQRRNTGTGSHGKEHQGNQQEVRADPGVPEPWPEVELKDHEQQHHHEELDSTDAAGAHWAESLSEVGGVGFPPSMGELGAPP
jgi:hypothetical protein